MKLHIVTPKWNETIHVDWVELNTDTGNYVIQLGHKPMILLLSIDEELVYKPLQKKSHYLLITEGVVHITRSSITAIVTVEE